MKTLSLIAVILSSLLAFNVDASIICKKEGRFWYPKSEKAVKIAGMLGVKTCNGKRFKKVIAKLGLKSNVKTAKKRHSVDDVLAAFK